ncbi:similar to Scheffersomyces stipitis PICST_28429 beta alanine synthase [Scheffersomyces stipitis CBS 6054] [Maudiozyma saulgeensis]|uniref:Similar to Scheffersomyces stipitis PICST_28429 beta alanine synthase [Scheffersomyces stipitis CBS 6054] n=1 Tax=Maudiozyma saulgeensis TaxID=1789683 RepID=A0A1X7R5W1_9SACH|nr:similar to Scheffersomyces stipitis PICST_28429 beta alanine synthase [Scheffersomyces stipitis CBS 6054] [Kazachstania saulgeensis]
MTTSLRTVPNRLSKTIHQTSKWGAKYKWGPQETETGMCRLSLSQEDKNVRDWFVKETKSLGCEVKIDQIGNIFAIYPGQKKGPPTGIGSHLDTQPTGGRYDGVLGVLAGLEVLRTFRDNNYTPQYPVAVVNWTNEEGARFPKSIMASSVWAGVSSLKDIYAIKSITDEKPVTVLEALESISYKGKTQANCNENPLKAHFELHIEQGPILEKETKKIGVVTSAQAYSWIGVNLKGRAQHTGTTPMDMRADPFLTAAKMTMAVNEIAERHLGLGSVAELHISPNVVNVIPKTAEFIIDIRHATDVGLENIENDIKRALENIVSDTEVILEFKRLFHNDAAHFDKSCIDIVQESASMIVGENKTIKMLSGAGHDSCSTTNANVPTAMIFIPSKGGISHNPTEYSSPEEIENGFKVLLNTIITYDARRTM